MSRGLTLPDVAGQIGVLKQRVTDLERQLSRVIDLLSDQGLPFNLPGSVTETESDPWTARSKIRLSEAVILLGTAGSTTTTVKVKVNGTAIGTFSMGADEVGPRKFLMSHTLAPDQDVVTVEVTAAGTGAENLDVILRWAMPLN